MADRWRPGLGDPWDLGPPPHLHSLLRAEPTCFLHLPGWQYHLWFPGRPSWSPVASVHRLTAPPPCASANSCAPDPREWVT